MTNTTTTTVKKVTKRDKYAMLRAIVSNAETANKDELLTFIDNEVNLLNKKNSGNSKTSKENIERMSAVKDAMRSIGRPATCTEIMNKLGYSSQRTSMLLHMMGEKGTKEVVRTVDKKKALFELA